MDARPSTSFGAASASASVKRCLILNERIDNNNFNKNSGNDNESHSAELRTHNTLHNSASTPFKHCGLRRGRHRLHKHASNFQSYEFLSDVVDIPKPKTSFSSRRRLSISAAIYRFVLFLLFSLLHKPFPVNCSGGLEIWHSFRLYGVNPSTKWASAASAVKRQCASDYCHVTFCARPLFSSVPSSYSTIKQQRQRDDYENATCMFGYGNTSFRLMDSEHQPNYAMTPLTLNFTAPWENTFELEVSIYDNAASEVLISKTIQYNESLPVGGKWQALVVNLISDDAPARFELDMRLRVQCASNYYAQYCASPCEPSAMNGGHFDCDPETGARRCLMGWLGANCDVRAERCVGVECVHGECNPETGVCKCYPGYQGGKCEQCMTSAECKGKCTRPYECLCAEGRGGLNCDKDTHYCAHNSPCLNGGNCVNDDYGSYTCSCAPGFAGRNCERQIKSCSDSPCLNNSTCLTSTIHPQSFRCECAPGAYGRYCQSRARSCADCANSVSCVGEPRSSPLPFKCNCAKGWSGTLCDTPTAWCAHDKCRNGGTCIENANAELGFECRCANGYTGAFCETNIDDCEFNPCQNNGVCVDEVEGFLCQCPAGFVGVLCQDVVSAVRTPKPLGLSGESRSQNASASTTPSSKFIVGSLVFISGVLVALVVLVWHVRVHLAAKIKQTQAASPSSASSDDGGSTTTERNSKQRREKDVVCNDGGSYVLNAYSTNDPCFVEYGNCATNPHHHYPHSHDQCFPPPPPYAAMTSESTALTTAGPSSVVSL